MSTKQWIVLIIAFLVLAILLFLADFVFAGVLYVIVVLFDSSVAGIVFKWVLVGLLLIELPLMGTYLFKTMKNERNEI